MTDANINRLAGETSPYLLQHAENPVHWQPWSEDAFTAARELDRPVLLSIGYSACHWCHVMAHESFENDEIAALMNGLFVNVKVDREERPDLDKLYQTAHQLLAQRPGGWPLTVFLDPQDKLPFFAGTYFPPQARHGMPSFTDVLQRVAAFYRSQRDEITAQKQSMHEVFARIDETKTATGALDDAPLQGLRRELEQAFDARWGGFGGAPKFPHAGSVELLATLWASSRSATTDVRGLHMASFTMEKMIRGGLYDQLGGGFFRYSVDERWEIPHFEKMLYDNGPLLAACANVAAATGEPLFSRTAKQTAQWIMREMQSPQGGYYATLDADSEGEEGRFYAWSDAEVKQVVGEQSWPAVSARFGLDGPPNFEGRYHLQLKRTVDEVVQESGGDQHAVARQLENAGKSLFETRKQRVHPFRDEKILTSWNGLAIRGMAIAARLSGKSEYAESATQALDFIREHMFIDGRLRASYMDGEARFAAYLDDYAHLADAIVELLQVRWRTRDLNFATTLLDVLLAKFEDTDNGGFFFTADDHEALFHRARPLADDSTPAGNGTATRAMIRIGYLLGENRYLDAAERTLRTAWEPMLGAPHAHATLVAALAEFLQPPEVWVIRGKPPAMASKSAELSRDYEPGRIVFSIDDTVDDLPAALALRKPRGELVTYVCQGHSCTVQDGS